VAVLNSVLRVIEVTAQRPLGLLSLLVFMGGFLAFVMFQGRSPRASIAAFWVVCFGFASLAYEVSETTQRLPYVGYYTGEAGESGSLPGISAPGGVVGGQGSGRQAVASGGGAISPGGGGATGGSGHVSGAIAGSAGGGSAGGASRSPSATSSAAGADGSGSGSPPVRALSAPSTPDPNTAAAGEPTGPGRWVPDGVATGEKITSNQPCPESGAAARDACKAEYTIAITCGPDQRLAEPQLRCVEGDCAAGAVQEIRVSPNGQRVDGRFEVWGAPTRWQLSAAREARVAAQ
jgi:hypothetical protein